MVKSLGTLAFLGHFPIHTSPIAPLTPQAKFTGNFSESFNFVWGGGGGGGGGEKQKNLKKDALFY